MSYYFITKQCMGEYDGTGSMYQGIVSGKIIIDCIKGKMEQLVTFIWPLSSFQSFQRILFGHISHSQCCCILLDSVKCFCGSHPGVKGWWHTRLQCQGGSGQFLSMVNMKWHSPSQVLTAKHVPYPQLTATALLREDISSILVKCSTHVLCIKSTFFSRSVTQWIPLSLPFNKACFFGTTSLTRLYLSSWSCLCSCLSTCFSCIGLQMMEMVYSVEHWTSVCLAKN